MDSPLDVLSWGMLLWGRSAKRTIQILKRQTCKLEHLSMNLSRHFFHTQRHYPQPLPGQNDKTHSLDTSSQSKSFWTAKSLFTSHVIAAYKVLRMVPSREKGKYSTKKSTSEQINWKHACHCVRQPLALRYNNVHILPAFPASLIRGYLATNDTRREGERSLL